MKHLKKVALVLAILFLSYLSNMAVNVLAANTGTSIVNENKENCNSISYIESGFPIRDVYIEKNIGEACGARPRIEMGDTRIGDIPFVLNWAFYFVLFGYLVARLRRKHENNRH